MNSPRHFANELHAMPTDSFNGQTAIAQHPPEQPHIEFNPSALKIPQNRSAGSLLTPNSSNGNLVGDGAYTPRRVSGDVENSSEVYDNLARYVE